MMSKSPMYASPGEQRAAEYAAYVQQYMDEHGRAAISMTDATEAIWGTSGRGNPNAVRKIEATAALGFLVIHKAGKRNRVVTRTAKPAAMDVVADIQAMLTAGI